MRLRTLADAGMLDRLIDDLLEECGELDAFVTRLTVDDWNRTTAFFSWTVRDQILHLHQVDRFGLISLIGHAPFSDTVAAVRAHQAQGVELSAAIRHEFVAVSSADVLLTWRDGYRRIAEALRAAPDGKRLDWFGPPMNAKSFASARLMEVWAHGQDIYDLFGVERSPTRRLRHICDLGVRTFGWSFRNRGLEVPSRPTVRLAGCDGAELAWTGEEGDGLVEGTTRDFALVVTQRRAPQETGLVAHGIAAETWLSIAQCFAGAPQEAAAPGSRPPVAGIAGH